MILIGKTRPSVAGRFLSESSSTGSLEAANLTQSGAVFADGLRLDRAEWNYFGRGSEESDVSKAIKCDEEP
jgi:hypothetical protein